VAERGILRGIGVSQGHAVGPVAWVVNRVRPPLPLPLTGSPDAACDLITSSAQTVRDALAARAGSATGVARGVLAATAAMATDPALLAAARRYVREDGLAPAPAVWRATTELAERFEQLGGVFAGRAADVRDVGTRIIAAITGQPLPGLPQRDHPHVLAAHDLTPADTATLDPRLTLGILTEAGGPTSHTAILARDLGIPAVVALGSALRRVRDGDRVGIDGSAGTVSIEEAGPVVASRRPGVAPLAGPNRTADGHRVPLLANVSDADGARVAAASGAEGIGLLRTEGQFVDAVEEPSLAEQERALGAVLAAFPGRRVMIRTLDAGGDNPLPFLPLDPGRNPALGLRGFRLARVNRALLENQLTAIARAAAAHDADVWVMAPMVSTVREAEEFVALAASAGLATAGVMVEVPAAALNAGPILARAAFASVGTNDLTQYTLAADRSAGELADIADPWDPAVLRLIALACQAGQLQDRPVGICGEASADPALAAVLVGLGAESLSMSPRDLRPVADTLATLTLADCQGLAGLALGCESAADARAAIARALATRGVPVPPTITSGALQPAEED